MIFRVLSSSCNGKERQDLGMETFAYDEELIQGNHLGLLPPSDSLPTFPLFLHFIFRLDTHLSLLPLDPFSVPAALQHNNVRNILSFLSAAHSFALHGTVTLQGL